jgi:dipeptidyl aminopeptidase/acylaminoacyl peptidase
MPDAPETMPLWERRYRAPTRTLPIWGPRSPDRFALLSDEEGSFQAYAWVPGSEPRRLTDEPVGVSSCTISADGTRVVWFSDPTGDESGRWLSVPFEGGEAEEVFPGAPNGWPDGLAVGRERRVGVIADRDGFAVYVAERGGAAREIHRDAEHVGFSDSDFHREGFDRVGLSADESLICLEVSQDGDSIHRKLLVMDPRDGSTVAELADGPGFALSAYAWSPVPGDQRMLGAHEREDRIRPTLWNPTTGERVDVAVDLPGDAIPVDWWPDAGSLLLVQLFRGRERLYRYDLGTRTMVEIRHPAGEIHGAQVRPSGRVWIRTSSGGQASRVIDDTGTEILPSPPVGVRDGHPYSEWLFEGVEGRVHGWVATPRGDGPFPLYLKVHGGPNWLYLDTWWPDVQSLLDEGFAVAMVNYRGSIGYGRAWRDRIIGNIGFPEVEDVISGLDDLVARGVADPERVVIGGWSWGGYITLLALGTHPERFAAGVAGVPVGDYMDSYDESAPSLQAYDRTLAGGVVHDIPEFIAERSPITYVDRVKAPVFVLVGEHDSRCVPSQVYRYERALRRAGGDVELYSYAEGHSSYVVDEQVREWGSVLEFLRRRVRLP